MTYESVKKSWKKLVFFYLLIARQLTNFIDNILIKENDFSEWNLLQFSFILNHILARTIDNQWKIIHIETIHLFFVESFK